LRRTQCIKAIIVKSLTNTPTEKAAFGRCGGRITNQLGMSARINKMQIERVDLTDKDYYRIINKATVLREAGNSYKPEEGRMSRMPALLTSRGAR
jgi:hypothetical protein